MISIRYIGSISSVTILASALLLLLLLTKSVSADIYRFVTVDGIETFTDSPTSAGAELLIKSSKKPAHSINNLHKNKFNHLYGTLADLGGTLTSAIGMRIDPFDGKWRQHNGIDIAIAENTSIKPVGKGIVVYSGTRSGYGNTVIVEHDGGILTLYAHNSRLLAKEGQHVTRDDIIALSGSTGRSTSPHLHFEAWQSGVNISTQFIAKQTANPKLISYKDRYSRTSNYRSQVLSDGSTLFTNIPQMPN